MGRNDFEDARTCHGAISAPKPTCRNQIVISDCPSATHNQQSLKPLFTLPTTFPLSSTPRFHNNPLYTTLTMAASSASKRLFKEYKALSSDPPEGITAGPMNEDDMFVWEALIQGPEGTPFEGGVFPAELRFPKDYPLAPPKMKFMTEMWHPNGA